MCVCVCVRACVRARARVCVCVRPGRSRREPARKEKTKESVPGERQRNKWEKARVVGEEAGGERGMDAGMRRRRRWEGRRDEGGRPHM